MISVDRVVEVESTETLSAGWNPPPDPPLPVLPPDCVAASGVHVLSDSATDQTGAPFDVLLALDPTSLCNDWVVPPPSIFQASQTSFIAGGSASAVGFHELRPRYLFDGDELYLVELKELATAESLFELVFNVNAPSPFTLTGSIEANLFGAGPFELSVRLIGPGSQAIVDESSSGTCDPPFGCPIQPIDESGELAAGTYTLRVRSAGTARSAPGPFMGPDDISFGRYDVTLDVDDGAPAVPSAPSSGALALALLLSGAAALVGIRTRRDGRRTTAQG